MKMIRILAFMPLALALDAFGRGHEAPPKDVEQCLLQHARAENGRGFDSFLDCCMRLGLDEKKCREEWAGQVEQVPPEMPPPDSAPPPSLR